MDSFTFTAGRLLCGDVREFLKKQEFLRDIKFIESKGFIERDFTVKGKQDDVVYVLKCLNRWVKDNDL